LPLHEELICFISNTNLFMNDWHLFKQYSFVVLLQHHEFLAWLVIGVREFWQRTFCCEGLGELWPKVLFFYEELGFESIALTIIAILV
jgi:hypothetical protein